MCGIVGYYGKAQPTSVLLNGLKKLEYRGYDSAGVAVHSGKDIKVVRAKGKIINLEKRLGETPVHGNLGIGHTRWATHGAPSEVNAHPHMSEHICVVHNGIIENYQELIDEHNLSERLQSQTDSEVIACLIADYTNAGDTLVTAVQKVMGLLAGAYAVLVTSEKDPETMVAFKKGPPLLIGHKQGEVYFASDAQAVIEHTQELTYLEDDEIAFSKAAEIQFFNKDLQSIEKKRVKLKWDAEQSEKMGFKHFMLKEIYEQPRAVAAVLGRYTDPESKSVDFSEMSYEPLNQSSTFDLEYLKKVERIFIVACGTSYYAGMYGEYLIEKLSGVPVEIDFASEFRYRDPVVPKNSLVIVISQSGETADTLAVLRQAKAAGAQVLSITNTKASTIDRESHAHLYMTAGIEIGVASTKAFTSTLAVVNLFAIYLARLHDKISESKEQELIQGLLALPSQMEMVLSYDKYFKEAAKEFKDYRGFLYLGRGMNFPISMEGALKLKELAYLHAEGYAAGEMKHGPLALISDDMLVVVICPKDQFYEKTLSNLQEAKARGGNIMSIGTGDDKALKDLSLKYLSLPRSSWMSSGILSVITVQLLAYHVADVLSYDVDQPRNLAKSVTVE